MTTRKYIAEVDTGRIYRAFWFESSHRAGSKANFDDAKRAYWRKYGYGMKCDVLKTYLSFYEG